MKREEVKLLEIDKSDIYDNLFRSLWLIIRDLKGLELINCRLYELTEKPGFDYTYEVGIELNDIVISRRRVIISGGSTSGEKVLSMQRLQKEFAVEMLRSLLLLKMPWLQQIAKPEFQETTNRNPTIWFNHSDANGHS